MSPFPNSDRFKDVDEPDPYGYEDNDPCEWCGLGAQECRCVPFDEEEEVA